MNKLLFTILISLLLINFTVAQTGINSVNLQSSRSADKGKIKVILDTDIGDDIDDAWALGFVLQSDRFEPLGITIAHKNTPARAKIACKMLYKTGHKDLPVAVGRKTADNYSYQFSWAEDFNKLTPVKESAADLIVRMIRKYPGQVVLLAVGPLENIADALRKEPNLPKLVRRVVLMSGNIYSSVWSPAPIAEWNVAQSVKDAQLVYGAGLPLTIVPLDATTYITLRESERNRVRKRNSSLTQSLECLYRLWIQSPQSKMTLHDQLAVAETAEPGKFFHKIEELKLIVDDKGFTKIDNKKGKTVKVCFQPKRDEFMKYYIDTLVK